MNPKRSSHTTKRRCRSLLCDRDPNLNHYTLVPCNNNSFSRQRAKSSFSQRFISAAHEIVHEVLHSQPPKPKTKHKKHLRVQVERQHQPSVSPSASNNNTPLAPISPTIQSTSISPPSTRRTPTVTKALVVSAPPRGKKKKNKNTTIPALRCYVPKYLLEGGTAPPFKRSAVHSFFSNLRPKTAVNVERIQSGLSASVLYCPEIPRSSPPKKNSINNNNNNTLRRNININNNGFTPTSLVTNRPRSNDPNLVYQDSSYEVRVSGMMVADYDMWGNDNELLMYSVQNDGAHHGENNETLPYIHFDYQRDGIAQNEKPNCYIPIPASKSYVVSSTGKQKKKRNNNNISSSNASDGKYKQRRSINVQFRILELDDPSPGVKAAVKGIDEFAGSLNMLDPVAPFIGALTPALSLAGSLSKRALDSYAQPDKVISIDMDFLLADRERVRTNTAAPGEYLRYGYYFFLSEPVEGKLFASVRTPKNVQLMLKQHSRAPGQMEYFPLTEISYLVVRVTEPTDSGTRRNSRRPVQLNHAHQLERIFQQAKSSDPQAVQNAVKKLGKDLGVLHSDDEDDDNDDINNNNTNNDSSNMDNIDAASPPPTTSTAAATAAKVM